MARVTIAEVKEIMPTLTLDDTNIAAFILGATTLVDQVLSSSGLGTDLLKEIERWLTAHMISLGPERMAKKEGAGGAEIEYVGVFGEGLKSTTYGQMVIAMDTSGSMAALAGKTVSITAIKSFE